MYPVVDMEIAMISRISKARRTRSRPLFQVCKDNPEEFLAQLTLGLLTIGM
jgi:hypothetical protein